MAVQYRSHPAAAQGAARHVREGHNVTLRPGSWLHSTVCTREVMVVRAPSTDVQLACGGAAMTDSSQDGAPTGARVRWQQPARQALREF
jgi:hypothetical protein